MTTDLKSDATAAIDADPRGAFAPARATLPPPPGSRASDFSPGGCSHTLAPSGEAPGGSAAAKCENRHGVGGDVSYQHLIDQALDDGDELCPGCRGATIGPEGWDCEYCHGSGVL